MFLSCFLVVPEAPEILRIDRGVNNLEIHWKVTIADPNYPILDYLVQIKQKEGSQKWMNCTQMTSETSSMMCVMNELETNTEYVVRLAAKNVVGYSEFTVKEVSTEDAPGNNR